MEGATQKSLDEEIKSTDNVPIESTLQKSKPADEDPGQVKPDSQPSNNATLKKDSKLHSAEEGKEKCTCSASNSHTVQNGQNINVLQEKDAVDSVDNATVTPQSKESENVTLNNKANGTHIMISIAYNLQYFQ